MNNKFLKMAVAGLVLFVSGFANAGIITYTDRLDFQNNTGSLLSFEGFNNAFDTDITVNAAGGYSGFWTVQPSEGTHNLALIETSAVTFTFGTAVYAFGFDAIEMNLGSIDYLDSAGNSIADALLLNIGSQFFGVVSDTLISSFTLGTGSDSSGGVYFVDALETRTVTDVPEPSTLAILGLGLMGLAARRFKKQA